MIEVRTFLGGYPHEMQGDYLQKQQVIGVQRFMIDLMHGHLVKPRGYNTVPFESKDLSVWPQEVNCAKGNSIYRSLQSEQQSMCISQPALRSSREQCTDTSQANPFMLCGQKKTLQ